MAAEVARPGVELATTGRLHVTVSREVSKCGWDSNALEQGPVVSLGHVIVDDPLARLLADLRGELRHSECNITAKLVDLAGAARGREDDGCGLCEVGARGSRVAAVAGGTGD